jgi:hypothetical protein
MRLVDVLLCVSFALPECRSVSCCGDSSIPTGSSSRSHAPASARSRKPQNAINGGRSPPPHPP